MKPNESTGTVDAQSASSGEAHPTWDATGGGAGRVSVVGKKVPLVLILLMLGLPAVGAAIGATRGVTPTGLALAVKPLVATVTGISTLTTSNPLYWVVAFSSAAFVLEKFYRALETTLPGCQGDATRTGTSSRRGD